MSYDLMVFDATKAPKVREEFIVWFKEQTQWNESHDYEDISVTSPALKNWFMEMKQTFPPLNGAYAPTDEMMAKDEDLEAHLTDYSIGYDIIYAGFRWSVAEEAITLMVELAQKHGVGFYDVSSDDGDIIFPESIIPKGTASVTGEKTKHAKIEVRTQKDYLFLNFLRQIIPMTVWIGLAIAVVLFLVVFIVVGGSLLIYDLTGVDSLGTLADAVMDLFEELFMHFGITLLIGLILGIIGAGFVAFYFQNIRVSVDEKEVSFWRGKKKYRSFNLGENEISSFIQTIRHYFLFKTTTRYLTVKKPNGKWRRKYQCFGVSEADFNQLLNHIWFDATPTVDTAVDEEVENMLTEERNFDVASKNNCIVDERPKLREAVVKQLEETDEYDIFPLTFRIDKKAYIKGYKQEIISNFVSLLLFPILLIVIFMLILGMPVYVMSDVLRDSFPVLAIIFGIILVFILYRSIKQRMLISEIQKTTPIIITVEKTRLQIGNSEFTVDDIEEIRVTPPSYYTKDNLHTFRRHLTITTKNGIVQRFLLGDAPKAKWLYWVNFLKSRKNIFEDYAIFCQILQIWLADENESRFKLELE